MQNREFEQAGGMLGRSLKGVRALIEQQARGGRYTWYMAAFVFAVLFVVWYLMKTAKS